MMKPTNPPTQDQPNPRKIRLKVAIGPLFSRSKINIRGLGLILYRNRVQETKPNQILRKHPINSPHGGAYRELKIS